MNSKDTNELSEAERRHKNSSPGKKICVDTDKQSHKDYCSDLNATLYLGYLLLKA